MPANPVKFTQSVDFLPFDSENPPYDDGEPLETNRHRIAMNALINSGQQAFQLFAAAENWEGAVQAGNIMYGAEQSDSLVALGNGV
jgi:hypothetical protein